MPLFSGGEDARNRYYRMLEEFERSQDKISILLEMLGGRIRDLEEAVESVADY